MCPTISHMYTTNKYQGLHITLPLAPIYSVIPHYHCLVPNPILDGLALEALQFNDTLCITLSLDFSPCK